MTTRHLVCAVLAAPFLCAQDAKAKPEMPNPKVQSHEALAMLAGDWQCTCKMAAMPGVPGMEAASEWTGTEHAELICNGLWLKSSIDSKSKDQTFRGCWLMGYDPIKSKYVGIWVSSHDEPSSTSEGTFDEATKSWTFRGRSPMGEFRSVYACKDANNSIETCYATGADGKESECMQIVRTRIKGGIAKDASSTVAPIEAAEPPTLAKEHALLAEGTGRWDAVVTTKAPGQDATEEKGTEHVIPICDGKWTWSDFKGTMMGMPFEGHALTGYESDTKRFVSYWIDCCSPHFSKVTGTYDAAKKVFTFSGTCIDMNGKPATIQQVYAVADKNTRNLTMTMSGADGTQEMKIAYKRTGD
ncbi:MAG TPA: DUF1579 family protein [Planctomycetota bacterium]|nr:DUF1579 family protein [Planctomycetota bacterium]